METKFYIIIKSISCILFKILYRPKIIGLENIPKEGAVVLAGNHTSWLDPIMLVALTSRQIHFLAKDSLFKGITKPIVVGMGAISVDRSTHDKQVLKQARQVLEKGRVIGVFPEGTINYAKKTLTLPFKIGAIKMAYDTKSALVPFIITGQYKLFSSKITIEFLPQRAPHKDLAKENNQLRQEINQKLEEYNERN